MAAADVALKPLPAILLSLSHCLPHLVTAADHRDTFYTFDDVGVSFYFLFCSVQGWAANQGKTKPNLVCFLAS